MPARDNPFWQSGENHSYRTDTHRFGAHARKVDEFWSADPRVIEPDSDTNFGVLDCRSVFDLGEVIATGPKRKAVVMKDDRSRRWEAPS